MAQKARRKFYFLERVIKGFANHRRIEILDLLEEKEELSTEDICDAFRYTNENLRRLVNPSLVWKRRIVKNDFGLYYQSRQKASFKS